MSLLNQKFGTMLSRDQMKGIKGGDTDAVLYCSGPTETTLILYGTGCNDHTSGENMATCSGYDALFTSAICSAGPPP